MSKSKNKPSSPATGGKPTPKRPWLAILGVLIFGLASITTLHLFAASAAAGSFAALYLFSNDGKVSGRMSGDVKMRNGRSRAMAFPALVRNAYTTAIRSSFAAFSTAFRGLSASEIDQWNNFSYKHSDRFANTIDVKGKMAYIGVNQNLTDIGQPSITAPLAFVGTFDVALTAPVTATSAGVVTVPSSIYNAANKYLVFATKSLSAGVRRPSKSAFRVIGVDPTITLGVMDLSAMYNAKFGAPIAGGQIFVLVVAVDKTTGEKSVGSNIVSGIVT
jgi:hypothetical protein